MKARRMLAISDLIWFSIGPLLFLAGIYVSSWFFIGLIGLFVGLGFCMRDIHSTVLRQDHPVPSCLPEDAVLPLPSPAPRSSHMLFGTCRESISRQILAEETRNGSPVSSS